MRQKLSIICILFILFSLAPAGFNFHNLRAIDLGPVFINPDQVILQKEKNTHYVNPGKDVLQKAVDNALPGDTLVLRKGTYNGPYRGYYQEADYIPDVFKFAQAVEINKAITIRGEGEVIVKNNPFKITSNDVTVENITFQDTYGGGISIRDCADVTITGCTLKGNEARYGAGIYITGSEDVIVEKCVFEGNDAYFITNSNYDTSEGSYSYTFSGSGGGGYITKSNNITFAGCNFTENIAYNSGGALSFNDAGTGCQVRNCVFEGNWTDKNGGALHTSKTGGLTVSSSRFLSNMSLPELEDGSTDVKGYGGAVYSDGCKLEIYDCEMRENQAYNGGAIYSTDGDLTVKKSWLYDNEAKYLKKSNITAILTVVFTLGRLDISGIIEMIAEMVMTKAACPQNTVFPWDGWESFGGQGGAVYAVNTALTVKNSQITRNTSDKEGGGVFCVIGNNKDGIACRFENTVFMYNKSQKGGGAASLAKDAVFDNCVFERNQAEAVGGGLYSIENSTIIVSEFTGNRAPVGGGICSSLIGKTTDIRNCVFEENLAYDGNNNGGGGALYAFGGDRDADKKQVLLSDCRLNLAGCTFQKNASYDGGAVSLVKLTAELSANRFTENGAMNGGGALYTENSDVDLETTEFKSNESRLVGGAVVNLGSTLFINRSKFLDNKAVSGGGIYTKRGAFRAANSLFTGNTAGATGSVMAVEYTNTAALVNCTLALNWKYPLMAVNHTFLDLYNNIIVSNSTKESVSAADIFTDKNSRVNAQYNICEQQGTGNIGATIDIFRNPDEGDFRIRYDFAGDYLGPVEAGNNEYCNEETGHTDLAGNARIVDNSGDGQARVDMGAYEQDMLKVTFAAVHPLASVAYGSISGETRQVVEQGHAASASLVSVTPLSGWEFAGWEKLDHTKVTDLSRITGNLNLYATYQSKLITVKYKFDPNKLKPVSSSKMKICSSIDGLKAEDILNAGLLEKPDGNTHQLTTYVKQYNTPIRPEMEGINGWAFSTWIPWPPSSVSADTTVDAVARPTVTYDFGNKGEYGKDRQKAVTSDQNRPLFVPKERDIKVDAGYKLLGWSDKQGGKTVTLPGSIDEPVTFYAVYGDLQPAIILEKVNIISVPFLPQLYYTWYVFSDPAYEGTPYTIKGHVEDKYGERWAASIDYGDTLGPRELKINPDKTFSTQHVFYDKQKNNSIAVKVLNNYGYQAAYKVQVPVKNIAPEVEAGENGSCLRGVLFKRQVTFTDPGADDWTAMLDYGDGKTVQAQLTKKSFDLAHVYEKNGSYLVGITISDQDDGTGKDSFRLKVKDYLLQLQAGEDTAVTEGESFAREVQVQGPADKIKSAEVDFGDKSAVYQLKPSGILLLNHTFRDDGTYKVTVRITDIDGDEYTGSFNVIVKNTAPDVNAGTGINITRNETFRSSGSFSDPGQDSWKAEVNYGDGSGWQLLNLDGWDFSLQHSYSSPGDYLLTVRVSDDDGGVGTGSCEVNVRSKDKSDQSGFDATLTEDADLLRLSITNAKDNEGNLLNGNFNISVICEELAVNEPSIQTFVAGQMNADICEIGNIGVYTFAVSVEGITHSKHVSVELD